MTLNDLLCENRKSELKQGLVNALEASDYALGRGVSVYKMLLRVNDLEKLEPLKELQNKLRETTDDLVVNIAKKADKKETNTLISKKAAVADFLQVANIFMNFIFVMHF